MDKTHARAMDIAKANEAAWDEEVLRNNYWTRIVSEEEIKEAGSGRPGIMLSPVKKVPLEWLKGIKGARVLNLAGGGGQQTPVLAAYGCTVTCLDNSRSQLEQDRKALERYGLEASIIQGTMLDLSPFGNDAFDCVINPVSLNFVDGIRRVFDEVHRVIRDGGTFMFGIANPIMYMFDDVKLAKGRMRIRYTLPFSDLKSISGKELARRMKKKDTIEFSHTLDAIIGGVTEAGFAVTGFYSDHSDFEPVDSFVCDCYLVFRCIAIKH